MQNAKILARLTTLAKQIRTIELGTSIEMPQVQGSPRGKLETSSAKSDQKTAAKGPRPRVVVGVIDDGLAFAHERFRLSNGNTRFKYFLNQDDGTSSFGAGTRTDGRRHQ